MHEWVRIRFVWESVEHLSLVCTFSPRRAVTFFGFGPHESYQPGDPFPLISTPDWETGQRREVKTRVFAISQPMALMVLELEPEEEQNFFEPPKLDLEPGVVYYTYGATAKESGSFGHIASYVNEFSLSNYFYK
jgi:hypothetical protein